MKKVELNDNELNKIFGGTLTKDAEDWVSRNRDKIVQSAGALGGLADFALNLVRKDTKVYDVLDLKAAIKSYGINVDDLN